MGVACEIAHPSADKGSGGDRRYGGLGKYCIKMQYGRRMNILKYGVVTPEFAKFDGMPRL